MTIDPNSPTWQAVKIRVEAELATAQDRLERPLDPAETNIARGMIKAYRSVLGLVVPKPQIVDTDPGY